MKRSLMCISLAAATLFAGAAFAKDGDEKFRKMDTDSDGRITASEHAAHAQQMFTMIDTNRDGAISRQEMEAHKGMKKSRMHGMSDRARGDKGREGMRPDDAGGN